MRFVLALAVAIAGAVAAPAQLPAPKPIATPADKDAIVLNAPAHPAALAEQWETMGAGPIARNVTTSTLTPVLPETAKATGAAVIVAPGGAFAMLSMDNEGYQVARWLAEHGIAAFVLKYRVEATDRDPQVFIRNLTATMQDMVSLKKPPIPTPREALEDARAAVRLVRKRAGEWKVDPARVGFVGFSAGAQLTLTIGVDPDGDVRPNFIAPIYGPTHAVTVPADAAPMFFAMAGDDPLFAKGNFDVIGSWRGAGRPVEFHYYEKGGHGFGMLHQGTTSDMWIDEFYAWMKARGVLGR